jgi:hypothetical protein
MIYASEASQTIEEAVQNKTSCFHFGVHPVIRILTLVKVLFFTLPVRTIWKEVILLLP